jgi:hypothetical protein
VFELKFDVREFERRTRELEGTLDQMPFALALALTEAAEITKQALVDEWPQHITQRNPGFIKRALQVKPATKHDLRVEIYDSLGRAHLELHADGGTKQAKGKFAIPVENNVQRGARGVSRSKWPRSLANSFVADLHGKGAALWVRYGRKGRRLRLMYALRAVVPVRKDVPFRETFAATMMRELRQSFPAAMKRAMSTRIPR